MKFKISISNVTIILTLIIVTAVSNNLNWGKNRWKGIIESDGKGYYAYLPAVFIYNDLNFGFFDHIEKEKYYNKNWFYDYRSSYNGKIINKYYCGTAVAQLPFFLLAHSLSSAFNYDLDGYSKLYQIFNNLAAIFYLLLGLFYLKLLLRTYQIKEWHIAFTLVAATFGTNLFYYATCESGMSHVYSFGFVTMFLYYAKKYFSSLQSRYVFILALLLGIITLIRPINGLVLLILPFISGDFSTFKIGIMAAFRNKIVLLSSVLAFLAIVFIQLYIYKISTGNYLVYSYQKEGFNFLAPEIINILFSYKKGLFLYTPLLLISLSGGYFLWRSSKFAFYSWFGFFGFITYILSCWWMWYYGGSFSSRVYIEYISVFMILLALTLNSIESKMLKRFYIGLVILLIVICQIQTYQYRYYHIHWSDMNKEKYWDVFLRVDRLIKK